MLLNVCSLGGGVSVCIERRYKCDIGGIYLCDVSAMYVREDANRIHKSIQDIPWKRDGGIVVAGTDEGNEEVSLHGWCVELDGTSSSLLMGGAR